ncbi:MAG: hypothetical protein N2554_07260 [Fimbriimonadales bacterium]|nr:hypothetical protein [Fimbriimonadales bacterium]
MRWLSAILVLMGVCLHAQPQQGGQIQFGKVKINYADLDFIRRVKSDVAEIRVLGKRGAPVRVESPEQYFTMTCLQLQATLAPDEQNRLTVRSAEASGQVNFRYDRSQPLSRLDGTAQRVVYDGKQRTVTFEGDVSLDGEDEFYIMRWRNNERVVVYLEEELQRVEARSKEQGGKPIGEMIIEPKKRNP